MTQRPLISRLLLVGALWAASVATPQVAGAHDSPEHSIEDLTAHIKQQGESVRLLLLRASHYRVLGQAEQAIADLNRVLEMEPNQQGALVELARLHLALGKAEASLNFIEQAIGAAGKSEKGTAHLLATRADIYLAKTDYNNALTDYNRALAADATQIDWHLNRSWTQAQLNRHDDRIKGLANGFKATGSVVLQNEWIEALIDGGQAQTALRVIEPQLQQARLKSSWLLRRARAGLALQSTREPSAAIRRDLSAAIAEINLRLRPTRPDIDLLLDRALAHLLSGDVAAARHDAALAESYGAAPRRLERLIRQIESMAGKA